MANPVDIVIPDSPRTRSGSPKTPQQRYLERIVETVPCACGCGGEVVRRRTHCMPSYWKKFGLPSFLPKCNPKIKEGRARGVEKRASDLKGQTGEKSPRWNGGRTISSEGYAYIRIGDHYAAEHRLVMEDHLGRSLNPCEHVHHENGNRLDNRLGNLRVLTVSQHAKMHNGFRLRDARGRFLKEPAR